VFYGKFVSPAKITRT